MMPTNHAHNARAIMETVEDYTDAMDQRAVAGFVIGHALLEIAAQIERLADARQRRHGHKIGGDDEFAKYERQFAGKE